MACAQPCEQQPRPTLLTESITISLTLYRLRCGRPECIFTFAGDADTAVVEAVLQHVRHLAGELPGEWRVKTVVSESKATLLQQVNRGLSDLRRQGLRHRLVIIPGAVSSMKLSLVGAAIGGFPVERTAVS